MSLILASWKNGKNTDKVFTVGQIVLQTSSYARMEVIIVGKVVRAVVLGLRKLFLCLWEPRKCPLEKQIFQDTHNTLQPLKKYVGFRVSDSTWKDSVLPKRNDQVPE